MNLLSKIIIILVFTIYNNYNVLWYDINIIKWYEKIYKKNWEKTIILLENILDKKIEQEEWNKEIINELIKINNEKSFSLEMEKEKKYTENILNKNNLSKKFKNKILNKHWLVKENWVWYYYNYENYLSFWVNNFNENDLKQNFIDYNNDIITEKDWKIVFIKNYKKYRIISDSIIYWIPWKMDILKDLSYIKNFDKKNENLDKDFIILKSLSKKLTSWVIKKEEKIKILYDYIINNLKYDENIIDWNYDIFSWIKTFKNKVWVCQWYVELLNIMLAFNNIKSEIIKWDVINSKDFPEVWHAWIKIDNFYYDPTFDDPVWATKNRKFEDYFYYKLPKDLFYTNRFNRWETPKFLKKLNLNQRQTYVDLNIFSVSEKYKNENFNILNLVKFKKRLWLSAKQEIKIENLINFFWIIEIIDNSKVKINWKEKFLKELEYFELNNDNLIPFLYKVKFNLDWYKLFKDKKNWKILISNKYSFR